MQIVLRYLKVLYLILTLPIMVLLFHCQDYQNETLKYFTHYVLMIRPPLIALVGDSHTAGGGSGRLGLGMIRFPQLF